MEKGLRKLTEQLFDSTQIKESQEGEL